MKTYPLFKVHVAMTAIPNIEEVFRSGFINEGIQVTQLTEALCKVLWAQNLLLVNSCTSALTLALHLAGIGPGSSVVSTPMTCVATNTPIVASHAKVIWADIDPESGMPTVDNIRQKVRADTRAVIVVAWAGTPPELKEIWEFCKSMGIKLILDAAHAFGALYEGVPIHHWADFTCYSFQAIKHFTTGDGGAIVCQDDADFKRAKALKWFGLDRDHAKDDKGNWKGQQWDVDIMEAGYKFNMNNVAAAIGLAQIPFIDWIIDSHFNNAITYDTTFKGFELIKHATRPAVATPSFWVYTVLVHPSIDRDTLLQRLNEEGIMAGVVHVPNDHYTAFLSSMAELPGVRWFSQHQISLPCGWWLNQGDIEHIASRVKAISDRAFTMRVFIGTMESGEGDFPKCIEAIKAQQGVSTSHFVVSGMPEQQAHRTLYSHWNSVKTQFDLFLKVDADTVLASPGVIKAYVELFEANPRLTGVQAWLHDYMTDSKIFGLTVVRNNVIINDNPGSLYCDRVDTGHDQGMRGDELPTVLNPAGYHCHHSTELQAFHYGVHRAKKNQVDICRRVRAAWKGKDDRIRGFALLGFRLANECQVFDYTSEGFKALYDRARREYDALLEA